MSTWNEHVTAAMIGTAQASAPALPAALAGVCTPTGDRTADFLAQAGVLSAWRRAGWKPPIVQQDLPPVETEQAQMLESRSAARLRMMLETKGYIVLLGEWLATVARLGKRVPPDYLPQLLELALRTPDLREPVLAAGGNTARWLAGNYERWGVAEDVMAVDWDTATSEQRLLLLESLRGTTPAEARAKVESTWKTDSAYERAASLAAMLHGLSTEDIPFLDAALDDRSKEVRRTAVDLLARIPESPFVARMTERAVPLLHFRKPGLLSSAALEVVLPDTPDKSGARDGLDGSAFKGYLSLGEKATVLVLILSAVPLRHWTHTFGVSPQVLIKAASKSDFKDELLIGWTWAAARQKDIEWSDALLDSGLDCHPDFRRFVELHEVLPLEKRASRILAMLKRRPLTYVEPARWNEPLSLLATINPWPVPLAREVLAQMQKMAAAGFPWNFRDELLHFLVHVPLSLLEESCNGWPEGAEGVGTIVDFLRFRYESLTELSQS